MTDSRQYLFKYGEKALEFYRKSLPRQECKPQDSSSQVNYQLIQAQQNIRPVKNSCKLNQTKRLTLQQGKQSKLKVNKSQKKALSRTKSRTFLPDVELSPKTVAMPTLRKSTTKDVDAKRQNSCGGLYPKGKSSSKKSLRPPTPFNISQKHEFEEKIKGSLEIRDFDSFVKEVLSSIDLMITSQSAVTRWLKYFKSCFERLYNVTEDYIRRYAQATQEVGRLTEQLRVIQQHNQSLSLIANRQKIGQYESQRMVVELSKKLEKLEHREKILMSTFELLKNDNEHSEESLLHSSVKMRATQNSQQAKTSKPKQSDILYSTFGHR